MMKTKEDFKSFLDKKAEAAKSGCKTIGEKLEEVKTHLLKQWGSRKKDKTQ